MSRSVFSLKYTMKAANRKGDIHLYSSIVTWKWDRESATKTADGFRKELEALGDLDELNVHINSPGGAVFEGVSMRAVLMEHKAKTKNVYIEGLCASAATLLASIPGAKVHIAKGSEYMIHNPRSSVYGEAKDMEHEAKHMRNMETTFAEIYSARTGKDLATCKEWMDNTTWFTAEQAVENGFADEVVGATETKAVACAEGEGDAYALMAELYGEMPEAVTAAADETNNDDVSSGVEAVAAATPSENNNEGMEVNNMPTNQNETSTTNAAATQAQTTQDAVAAAVAAERARVARIDALTLPGYEDMAKQAKDNGTSADDFLASVVEAQRKKGTTYLENRIAETAPAAAVTAGATTDNTPEADEKAAVDQIVAFAKRMTPGEDFMA